MGYSYDNLAMGSLWSFDVLPDSSRFSLSVRSWNEWLDVFPVSLWWIDRSSLGVGLEFVTS